MGQQEVSLVSANIFLGGSSVPTLQDGGASAPRGDSWLPDGSSASLARFTQAAETLATQAAGLFSSKHDAGQKAEAASAQPVVQEDTSLATASAARDDAGDGAEATRQHTRR